MFHTQGCNYQRLRHIAEDEGNLIKQTSGNSYEECKITCDGCNSFTYCPNNRLCYIYDKILHDNDAQVKNADCFSSYTDCSHSKYFTIWKHDESSSNKNMSSYFNANFDFLKSKLAATCNTNEDCPNEYPKCKKGKCGK